MLRSRKRRRGHIMEPWKRKLRMGIVGGGASVLPISQVATGEENGLTLRVYGSKVAILWAQENPNHLNLHRYGEPRQVLTGGQGYLSEPAKNCTRIPTGHPEGYLEA